MNNFKELDCYEEVAEAIGDTFAVYELSRVVNGGIEIRADKGLFEAFNWMMSPQGHSFWASIEEGFDPYEVETVDIDYTIKNSECFAQVSQVLGDLRALQELDKVIDNGGDFEYDKDLRGAFVWVQSPQGHNFWQRIHDKHRATAEGTKAVQEDDPVSHPKHYTDHPSGIECIQITEHMGFNLGNALKYIWRCDLKKDAVEDLEKAKWYINRELEKRNG